MIGAELTRDGTKFRVFAPKRKRVGIVFDRSELELSAEADGFFVGIADAPAGTRYRIRLDDDATLYPDPASRYQPEGPHGASVVVDPNAFRWTDGDWKGVELRGQVIYELHIGTFTKEGTYASAARELEELRDTGITLLEIMPLAEFPGRFGWGYDGVNLYAPYHAYGAPDDLRAFIDRAHALGLGVILDVVYNHIGPDGNFLGQFSDHFFTDKYKNDWGAAIDFETEGGARSYFTDNPPYWIEEFHFDGLRLDATQNIEDASPKHVIEEMVERARAAAKGRSIVIVAENEPQDTRIVRDFGVDALWNDDLHHSARVALTGKREAYYSSTKGTPQELISAMKWGYLFQGQYYVWQKACRGTPALDLEAPAFVVYTENHDQIANSATGQRLHELTSPARYRAMMVATLLAPGTPMLFQGQEYAASSQFLYFADHAPELAKMVEKGRLEFLEQFPSLRDEKTRALYIPPHHEEAFTRSKLDTSERISHHAAYDLVKDLLRLRREDKPFAAQDAKSMHGAVLSSEAFLLRYAGRLVLVNLGADLDLAEVAEPLLAPPAGHTWRVILSSEDPRYGGAGTPSLDARILTSASALVLASQETE